MIKDSTIKIQLFILILIILLGFLSILAMEKNASYELDEITQMNNHTKELNIKLLELRKHEKDFLARKDLKYVKQFKLTRNEFNEIEKLLDNKLNKYNLGKKILETLNKSSSKYTNNFYKIVNMQEQIGLNPTDGLYGNLRNKVQELQHYAKKTNDFFLLSTIYDLRKQEKDFMLRFDGKYFFMFNKIIKKLISKTYDSRKTSLLIQYQSSFNALVELERRKGFNHNEGLMRDMRNSIHKTSEVLKELTLQIESVYKEKQESISFNSIVSTVIVTLFTILTLIFVIGFTVFNNKEKN